jgi:hypothetical protein
MDAVSLERRPLLMAPLLSAFSAAAAEASPINPRETFVLQPNQIQFKAWQGVPPGSGEMAMPYGDLNKPGPYHPERSVSTRSRPKSTSSSRMSDTRVELERMDKTGR